MVILSRLKARCPHCAHRFFWAKSTKGIKFCPQCRYSLYIAQQEREWSISNPYIRLAIVFFLILLIRHHVIVIMYLNNIAYLKEILCLGGALLLLALSRGSWLSNLLFYSDKLLAGVDSYAQVKQDSGGYVPNRSSNPGLNNNKVMCCQSCGSQRIQYWQRFNQNLASQPQRFDAAHYSKIVEDGLLAGCLHCSQHYQRQVDVAGWLYHCLMFLIIVIVIMSDSSFVETLVFAKLPIVFTTYQQTLLIALFIFAIATLASIASNHSQPHLKPD